MSKFEKELKGTKIEVKNNDISGALRKLKKVMATEGVLKDMRKKEFYVSKGEERRINKNAATRRYQKAKSKPES